MSVTVQPDCTQDLPRLSAVDMREWPMNWENRQGNQVLVLKMDVDEQTRGGDTSLMINDIDDVINLRPHFSALNTTYCGVHTIYLSKIEIFEDDEWLNETEQMMEHFAFDTSTEQLLILDIS